MAAAIPLLRTSGAGQAVNGWVYPPDDIGFFGQDYAFRAAIAVGAIAALPPVEAMYLTARGEAGRTFTGAGPYRLSFPAGQLPPVDAFWSLTMYEATPDGQFFLTANPSDRFSIGDRTPGLRKNADGSLEPLHSMGNGDPVPTIPSMYCLLKQLMLTLRLAYVTRENIYS